MIEFKAECGHTVRARDEDAGGVVRCSYCGKQANVPQDSAEALDLLLGEAGALTAKERALPRRRRSMRGLFPKRGMLGGFDPFPIIIRMCYFALLLSVIIVITNMFILPLFRDKGAKPAATQGGEPVSVRRQRPDQDTARATDKGYLHRPQGFSGLFVTSTPPGATVYVLNAPETSPPGRIHREKGVQVFRTGAPSPRLGDGSFIVEVAMPWNDPNLKRYAGYTEFRRELERGSLNQKRMIVEDYFIPDEAVAVFFEEAEDQKYIVRQYRGIDCQNNRLTSVRALFLPRIRQGDGPEFAVEPLVINYIPDAVNYAFDERDVSDELEYYGVSGADRPWVIKALGRIGIMPYITPTKRIVVFKIGLEDGILSARVVREGGK